MGKNPLGPIFARVGSFLGKTELRKLEYYSKNANKIQEKLLRHLMKKNKTTVYGKMNNFDKVNSIEDYQNIVPFSNYLTYEDYIMRMVEKGEKGLITNKCIHRYTESSGSTSRSKIIPLSAWSEWVCQCFSFSAPVGCAVKYFKSKGRILPPQRGLLTAEVGVRRLPCGKTVSSLSSIPLVNLKPLVKFITSIPEDIVFPPRPGIELDVHYVKLRFALPDRNISYLGTIFITTLESMFFYLEENWDLLCDDIENGTINPSIKMPADIRTKLEKKLKPDPKRAEELRAEFRKGFDVSPIIPRIWKKCEWLYGMGTGALSLYSKKLRRYIGEEMPIHYLGYAATEALMAVPIELDSFEYVLLPQNAFFEFLPVDAPEGTRPLTISELEIGQEYEVILTNTSGFYRYRIEDVVKVTGYHNQSPKVTFCYRLNQVANITCEKINQMALDEIVDTFAEDMGEIFVGYSIYPDRSTSPGHYVLLIETVNEHTKDEEQKYSEAFEKALCAGNVLVAPQIKCGALGHCEVKFLKHGTYDEYREVLKSRGANLNQVKPIKVINNDERYDFFFSHTI